MIFDLDTVVHLIRGLDIPIERATPMGDIYLSNSLLAVYLAYVVIYPNKYAANGHIIASDIFDLQEWLIENCLAPETKSLRS